MMYAKNTRKTQNGIILIAALGNIVVTLAQISVKGLGVSKRNTHEQCVCSITLWKVRIIENRGNYT